MRHALLQSSTRRSRDGGLKRWERWAGHIGYAAEGMLYIPVGFFALRAAFGQQHANGSTGAMARLGHTLLGDVLLAALAAGLAAFVLWQLVVAIADPEHRTERRSSHRRVVRLSHLFNGVFHCVFVVEAVWSILGFSRATNERQTQVKWTASAFALPAGRLIVALAGAGIF